MDLPVVLAYQRTMLVGDGREYLAFTVYVNVSHWWFTGERSLALDERRQVLRVLLPTNPLLGSVTNVGSIVHVHDGI
jgi:hypothetical protein